VNFWGWCLTFTRFYKNLKRFGFVPLTGGCVSLLKQLSMHEAMFGKNNPPQKKQVKCQVKSSALWQEMVAAYPRAETNKSHSWWFQHVSICFNLSSQWNCPMEHLGKALLKPFKDSIGFMPRFKCLNHLGRISTVKLAGEMIIPCAEKRSGDVRVTSSKHLNRQSPWTSDARIVNF